MIEKVKEFWNKSPCNIRRSKAEVGSLQWCEDTKNNKYYVEPHILKLAEFKKWKGKRVLEIGCGIGIDTVNFAEHGAEVTAVDLSDRSIELAKKRARFYEVSNKITFYNADVEELDKVVPLKTYDLIYAFGSLHHTPNPEKAIECLRKYMGVKSELRMMVYNKWCWKALWILLVYGKGQFWKLDELVAKYSEAQSGCPVTYTYTSKSIMKLFNKMCLKDMWIDHIFSYNIKYYIQHIYKKTWYWGLVPKRVLNFLESKIGWHRCAIFVHKF